MNIPQIDNPGKNPDPTISSYPILSCPVLSYRSTETPLYASQLACAGVCSHVCLCRLIAFFKKRGSCRLNSSSNARRLIWRYGRHLCFLPVQTFPLLQKTWSLSFYFPVGSLRNDLRVELSTAAFQLMICHDFNHQKYFRATLHALRKIKNRTSSLWIRRWMHIFELWIACISKWTSCQERILSIILLMECNSKSRHFLWTLVPRYALFRKYWILRNAQRSWRWISTWNYKISRTWSTCTVYMTFILKLPSTGANAPSEWR